MARKSTFTSFINVEPAAGIDAALGRLEQKANATFGRIARSAAAAGRTTQSGGSGLGGGGANAGTIQGLAAAERSRASAIQRTAQAQDVAAAASARLTGKHLLESNAARAAAASTSQLERSLRLAAVAANVAQGPLGPVAGRLSAAATALRELSGVSLGFVGLTAGVASFARLAGAAQDVKSQLRPLFETQTQVNAAFADTQRIALEARSALGPVVDLYARLTLAGRDAGLTAARTSKLVEIAAKAAKLSGGAASSQEAALYQFSQGIGSGTLAGDELKSVREGALRLAKAIADGMGVPIAKLKELGKEGKLTPKVVADALERESARIDAELAKLPPTISSATAELSNAFTALINGTDEAYGITVTLAGGMKLLAGNLGLVVTAGVTLAAAYASIKAVDLASNTLRNVENWNQERQALNALAKEHVKEAQTAVTASAEARRASAERIVSLRAERTAIAATLAVQTEQAAAARTARNELTRKTSNFYLGRSLDLQALAKATDEARIADQNLANTQDRLRSTAAGLHQSTLTLTESTRNHRTATTGLATATAAAARASNAFRAAASNLLGAINPLGIAVAIGVNVLIQFALAEDRAAGAADRMAASQNQLAKFIDFTTGKLLKQNQVLVENQIRLAAASAAKASVDASNARRDFRTTASGARAPVRKNIFGVDIVIPDVSGAKVNVDPRLAATAAGYRPGVAGSAEATATRLSRLENLSAADGKRRDILLDRLAAVVESSQEAESQRSAERFLSGRGTKEDLRRIQGNFSGADVDFGGGGGGGGSAAKDDKATGSRKKLTDQTEKLARAEEALKTAQQERSDKRTDILARYDEQSSAMDRAAKDARELQQLIGKTFAGGGIYTQAMADADKARIDFGVRAPIREAVEEQTRGLEISRLRVAGYELEANALERALSLQDDIGTVTREEFEQLVDNERQQLKINDVLASRERQVSQILDLAQSTRDAFEDLVVGAQKGNIFGSIKNFGRTVFDNFARVQARQLTEKLFAGADAKLRELVTGSSGVDRAAEILANNVKKTSTSVDRLVVANDNAGTAVERFAARVNAATDSIGGGGGEVAGAAGLVFNRAAGGVSKGAGGALAAIASAVALRGASVTGGGQQSGIDPVTGEIVAVARPRIRNVPKATEITAKTFGDLGEKLDQTFKSGTFFSGIGKGVGKAFSGAGEGMLASGIAKSLGIKQSKTGAAVGGAIGSFLPIPGGGFIGGLVGGTLGGLFKKSKTGSSTLSVGADGLAVSGTATGNSGAQKKIASGLAGGVGDRLNQIADALGADLGGSISVSIGKRDKKFVVDTQGRGKTKGSGTTKFKDEAEAIAFALQDAINDGVLTGISAASQKILKSGQDLERAVVKAVAIESISKRLLQRTDPTRFAVEQLNDEFTKLIAYLNEGGASAQQFADAQKLYDLERADAISQASSASIEALQAFLDEMKGGSSSPFNKATVYQNAGASLNAFRADIAGGKAVDQNALLTAARNFQDASRELNGSSEGFFSDFNDVFALISKARDNVTGSIPGGGTLPGSPFDATKVTSAIADQVAATVDQTAILGAKLDAVVFALQRTNAVDGSAIGLLPGFAYYDALRAA